MVDKMQDKLAKLQDERFSLAHNFRISSALTQISGYIHHFPKAREGEDAVDVMNNLMMERFLDFHQAVSEGKVEDAVRAGMCTTQAFNEWSALRPSKSSEWYLQPVAAVLRGKSEPQHMGVKQRSIVLFLQMETETSWQLPVAKDAKPERRKSTVAGLPQFIEMRGGDMQMRNDHLMVAFEFYPSETVPNALVFRVASVHRDSASGSAAPAASQVKTIGGETAAAKPELRKESPKKVSL